VLAQHEAASADLVKDHVVVTLIATTAMTPSTA
jgi:hypothetical protein